MSCFHFLSMTLAQTRREQTFSSDVTALSAALFSGCVFSPKRLEKPRHGAEATMAAFYVPVPAPRRSSGGNQWPQCFSGVAAAAQGRPRRPRETLLKWSDSCVWRGERWNVGHRRLEYCWNLGGFASAFPPFFPCEATASVQIFPCN